MAPIPTGPKAPPSPSLPVLSVQFSLPEVCRTFLADPPSLESGEFADPNGCTVWYIVGGVPNPPMLLLGVLGEALERPSLFLRRQVVMEASVCGA